MSLVYLVKFEVGFRFGSLILLLSAKDGIPRAWASSLLAIVVDVFGRALNLKIETILLYVATI